MKKEVIIAIIIGISIGLLITFGIKTAEQSLHRELQNPQPAVATDSPDATVNTNHSLTILSPKDKAFIDTNKVIISGTTTPLSLIGAISSSGYNTAMADDLGNFSVTLSLSEGANKINLSALNLSGEKATQQITLIQADDAIDNLSPANTATPSPTKKKGAS